MRFLRSERGFSFIELLVVVLLLGILILIAAPNYFGAEADAKKKVDQANVKAINSALALYKFQNNSTCPTAGANFTAFLANTTYFPEGVPGAPHDADGTVDADDYEATYDASICRVKMSSGTLNHTTGAGHD